MDNNLEKRIVTSFLCVFSMCFYGWKEHMQKNTQGSCRKHTTGDNINCWSAKDKAIIDEQ